jgi:hypothetical protein
MFRRNISPPSSGLRSKPRNEPAETAKKPRNMTQMAKFSLPPASAGFLLGYFPFCANIRPISMK